MIAVGPVIRHSKRVPPLLTEDEYQRTIGPDPTRVRPDEEPPFDFWPYFDSIDAEDFAGHDFSEGRVSYAWQMPGGVYQHVLVDCETPDVFLVLVLDLPACSVYGHHLLDLHRLYGSA
jgi:hypothetical protein